MQGVLGYFYLSNDDKRDNFDFPIVNKAYLDLGENPKNPYFKDMFSYSCKFLSLYNQMGVQCVYDNTLNIILILNTLINTSYICYSQYMYFDIPLEITPAPCPKCVCGSRLPMSIYCIMILQLFH